ncbi:polysaccharide biosynthesis C-terminal domain-containing protein [Vibrio cyclitrophicus]|uniref:polysaccharide biosynthesis C-terminal domain-containing protein n=1 Tax=Vibrio cyclitrophicus TaxID=47951 RepID=UPI000C8215CD|nr:polysaccharide biosynthesis C-terminal domain-containing protein [Vibrio cyclitrophicus]PMN20048.1 hypothetical protein BCT37_18420 [Vibrio cyclitrophicus]
MKGTILITLEKYFSALFISLSFFILAKFVSVEKLGEFSAIEAVVMICVLFSLLSLDTVFQDYYIKNKEKLDIGGFYLSCFVVKLFFGAIGYFLSSFVIYSLGLNIYYGLIISTVIILKTTTIFTLYNVTIKEEKRYFFIGFFSTIISFLSKLMILFYFDTDFLPFFYITDFLILLVFSSISFYMTSVIRETYILLIMRLVKSKIYFVLSSFSIVAFGKIDQILLAKFLTFDIVANYSLAMKMIGLFIMISSAFNLTASRDLAISVNKDSVKYLATIRKLMVATFIIGFVFCTLNYFLSPYIIELAYGEKYIDSINIVKSLTPIILLIFISSSVGRVLVVEELGRLAFFRNAIGLLTNVVLNIYLIPNYGVNGVIYSAILSWLISLLVVLSSRKIRNIFKGLFYV